MAKVLQGEMPEGEETIVGVFDVEFLFVPGAVKAAGGSPQRIDEVEHGFLLCGKLRLHSVEGVEGDGGGQEIRHGRTGEREKATRGVPRIQNPPGRFRRNGNVEFPAESDCGGGCRKVWNGQGDVVGPCAAGDQKGGEAVPHSIRIGQDEMVVGIGTEGEKTGIGRSCLRIVGLVVASVGSAVTLDGLEDRGDPAGGWALCQGGVTPRKTTLMNEVELVEGGEVFVEEFADGTLRKRGPQGGECTNGKTGVIQVRGSLAITKSTVGILLRAEIGFDEIAGFVTEEGASEASDLEHFEAEGHEAKRSERGEKRAGIFGEECGHDAR